MLRANTESGKSDLPFEARYERTILPNILLEELRYALRPLIESGIETQEN